MPLYSFSCESCKKSHDLKMTFEQHENTKGRVFCQSCGKPMVQDVARLRFKLAGNGWFANEYGGGSGPGSGYEITQTELNQNLEEEKRAEDRFYNAQIRGDGNE